MPRGPPRPRLAACLPSSEATRSRRRKSVHPNKTRGTTWKKENTETMTMSKQRRSKMPRLYASALTCTAGGGA